MADSDWSIPSGAHGGRDLAPELDCGLLVEQAHPQGHAAPVLHAPGDATSALDEVLDPLVRLVAGELGPVKGELLLGDRERRGRRFEVGEEQLEQGQVAQFGRVPGGLAQPGPERLAAGFRDRERPASTADFLTFLGQEAQAGEPGRLLVQERVGERPEVPDRRRDVPLQLVRRGRSLPCKEAEDEVRGRGQFD